MSIRKFKSFNSCLDWCDETTNLNGKIHASRPIKKLQTTESCKGKRILQGIRLPKISRCSAICCGYCDCMHASNSRPVNNGEGLDTTPSYSLTTRASRGDMSCPGRSRETGTFLESEKRLPRSLMRLCFRKKG